MADTKRSPQRAPDFALHRVVTADDSGAITDKKLGINMDGYRFALLDIDPTGDADPAVEVLFWSPGAEAFVSAHTALTFAGAGANTAWQAQVEVNSRVILVSVTGGTGTGQTEIRVAGAEIQTA